MFNNFYEETKFLAEIEVRERMKRGPARDDLPAGGRGRRRQTGDTQKYDGPYFALRWLLKQPRSPSCRWWATRPHAPEPGAARLRHRGDLGALAAKAALGKTYQLADPEPLTIDEGSVMGEATGRMMVRVPMPVRSPRRRSTGCRASTA